MWDSGIVLKNKYAIWEGMLTEWLLSIYSYGDNKPKYLINPVKKTSISPGKPIVELVSQITPNDLVSSVEYSFLKVQKIC